MLEIFGTLYLAAELYEVGEKGVQPGWSVLAAVWLVLFQVPRLRGPVFGLFLLGSCLRIGLDFPDVPNHTNLYLLSHLVLLTLWIRTAVTRSALEPALRGSEDLVRWLIVVVYFAAAFHKLNTDFLDPAVSCAVFIVERLDLVLPAGFSLVQWTAPLLPWIALGWEASLPVLLLTPRLQWIGVALALSLHLYLVPLNFVDFAAAALAFLYLYLPAAVREEVYEGASASRTPIRVFAGMACVYPWSTKLLIDASGSSTAWRVWQGVFFFLAVGTLLAPVASHFWRTRRWQPVPMLPTLGRPAKLTVVLALLTFVFTPYLGLRSAGNFSMFSNLIVWTPRANHLLMPADALKLFDYTDDVVWFDWVDPRVRGAHRGSPLEGYGLPTIEFKKLVVGWREAGLSEVGMAFRYRGETWGVEDITREDEWATLPEWQRRLLDFRNIQPGGANTCRW